MASGSSAPIHGHYSLHATPRPSSLRYSPLRYSGAALRRLVRARDVAQAHYDSPLTVVDMAREAGLSRAHFIRSFREVFGTTPHEYLRAVRLEQARRSLARGRSVTETCLSVGFSSLGSFSRTFRSEFGESPRAWQKRVRLLLPSSELWPAVWIPACFLPSSLIGQSAQCASR
ncbi:MAG: AraC family transcriptional regulator [Myxococcota bacterium]